MFVLLSCNVKYIHSTDLSIIPGRICYIASDNLTKFDTQKLRFCVQAHFTHQFYIPMKEHGILIKIPEKSLKNHIFNNSRADIFRTGVAKLAFPCHDMWHLVLYIFLKFEPDIGQRPFLDISLSGKALSSL